MKKVTDLLEMAGKNRLMFDLTTAAPGLAIITAVIASILGFVWWMLFGSGYRTFYKAEYLSQVNSMQTAPCMAKNTSARLDERGFLSFMDIRELVSAAERNPKCTWPGKHIRT